MKKIKEFTIIILPDNQKIKLLNYFIVENTKVQLSYKERLVEINKVPFINDASSYYETYWFGKKNINGMWNEKVKICLDCIASYLLLAPDSGIKKVNLH